MSPAAHADGCDDLGRGCEVAPSAARGLDDPLVLRGMAGPRADVREAALLQQRSDVAPVIVDAEKSSRSLAAAGMARILRLPME